MKIYDLAIIGGGPGGIGAAVEAVVLGLKDVVLVEKGENHSQTIRKFYKDNKRVDKDYKGQITQLQGHVDFMDGTKESTLNLFDQMIEEHKVEVRFNTEVEKIKKGGAIFDLVVPGGVISAKNVIISIGTMGKPNKPEYKIPPAIKPYINFNLDGCDKGEKILVVGGGNSALEYAYDLADNHNEVTLSYRKGEFSRANPENIDIINEYVRELKLELWLNTNIVELQEGDNRAVKVMFEDREDSFDRIVYAIGGTTPSGFLQSCGIELDEAKMPILDNNNQTTVEGIYITGDLSMKNGGSIAIALNHSYHIVNHIKSLYY
jgi:thioredoxin reductase (NADPH)